MEELDYDEFINLPHQISEHIEFKQLKTEEKRRPFRLEKLNEEKIYNRRKFECLAEKHLPMRPQATRIEKIHPEQDASKANYADDEPIPAQEISKINLTNKSSDIDLAAIVKFSLRGKKKVIQVSSSQSQQIPILVTLDVDNVKSTQRPPIDLVCVIDHSGSMSGEKIKLVKNSFNSLLKYLNDTDRVSVVIFDGTNINLGMEHAFQVLKQRRYVNSVSSIFLLSDGLDSGAQLRVKDSLARTKLPEDVIIHAFGFGSDHDPKLMGDISDLRGGNFYFIKQLDTVDEAFVDCLGGLLSSVGQNVKIKVQATQSRALDGVQIVKAYGGSSMWTYQDPVYKTNITNLISGRQKNYVLELGIPATNKLVTSNNKETCVAKAQVEITGLNGQKVTKTAKLMVTVLNPNERLKAEIADKDVMKNFYRVKGASVIGEAQELADKKKHEEAEKILLSFKKELENSVLRQEVFIKNLVKDIKRTIENVQPKVYASYGKCEMLEDRKAQMFENANFKSGNCYRNAIQCEMLDEIWKGKVAKKE